VSIVLVGVGCWPLNWLRVSPCSHQRQTQHAKHAAWRGKKGMTAVNM